MKSLKVTLAIGIIASAQASGALIPGLFNTGVDAAGNVLPDGTLGDPHYKLTSVPGGSTTDILVRTSAGGYPIPPYMGDNTMSRWIGPNNNPQIGGPAGDYTYRTTFDLTGYNPLTALISGNWAVDDAGVKIVFNGNVIPSGVPNYTTFASFFINSGFLPGVNTLDFVVLNSFQAPGSPTALRVEMRGDVAPVPEPSTYLAGLSALGMLGLFGWRNRK